MTDCVVAVAGLSRAFSGGKLGGGSEAGGGVATEPVKTGVCVRALPVKHGDSVSFFGRLLGD